ncbi:MAG: cobalt-precorrin-5B (C(1))-methyltransferase CbiD [Rikenellaceae bacterium]
MIIIFGGTTEGRIATEVCDKAAQRFFYSTRGEEQQLLSTFAERITGGIDIDAMKRIISQNDIKLIIDAAHPYAQILHENIYQAAQESEIPVIRFEREQVDVEYDNVRYFDSLSNVAQYITQTSTVGVLALTGVKSAAALCDIASSHHIYLRVMDRELSHITIHKSGFPEENILFYDLLNPCESQNNLELCQTLNISAIVTKDSGQRGGFRSKVETAKRLNIPLLIIKRPTLPPASRVVYGEFGLRRAIEELLPNFYKLRTGFTTGSAATAASVAALKSLVYGGEYDTTEIMLPNGEPIVISTKVVSLGGNYAEYLVVKDGGDDPDITHHIEIVAKVTFLDDLNSQISIRGGEGVGRVTLPGIGLEVGECAINPTPRNMIRTNIAKLAKDAGVQNSIDVEISVPKGREIGAKTFNPRLGIVDGISILGTSGIVQPFSAEAFLESISRQVDIVKAMGFNVIAINSGAMSERYIKSYISNLPPQCYIHYGNLVGATIELASQHAIEHIYVGCMIGKAVKLANGAIDTHSKNSILDRDFIEELAYESQCSESTKRAIAAITTARELWSVVPRDEYRLFDLIAKRCFDHCKPLFTNGVLEFMLISETGAVEAVVRG